MKLSSLILFFLLFISPTFSLKSKAKVKLDSNIDPFQFLGISDFKKDLDDSFAKKKKAPIPNAPTHSQGSSPSTSIHFDSLNDLPKYFENGDLNTIQGLKAMTRFLTEDDERLLDNGGIYDESGFDGAETGVAELYRIGSDNRDKERAKSAATLWYKKTIPTTRLEPYSVTQKTDEDLVEWNVYEVIMMCCSGNMEIKRVCIPKNEELAMISFILEQDDKCENRVGIAEEFINKGLKYLRKIGMKNLAEEFENKKQNSINHLIKERKKLKEKEKLKELEKLKEKQAKALKKTKIPDIKKFDEKKVDPDLQKPEEKKEESTQQLSNTNDTQTQSTSPSEKPQQPSNPDVENLKSQIEALKQMLASKTPKPTEETKPINTDKIVEKVERETKKADIMPPIKKPEQEEFRLKEKQDATPPPPPKDAPQVTELKQEVNSLKDDLKDLKDLLKASLTAKPSPAPDTKPPIHLSNSFENKSSLPANLPAIPTKKEDTPASYPEP